MSAAPSPHRQRYAGRGMGKFRTSHHAAAVKLPGESAATLLPDPLGRHDDLTLRFVAANGRVPGSEPAANRPNLTIRDVNAIGNFTTFALRNDLTAIDPRDAAVIWDEWRRAVVDLKELMGGVSDDDQALIVGVVLHHRTWNAANSLATALRQPGEVFEHYCPWRHEWATAARLHPERRP